MADPVRRRYINVRDFKLGAIAYNTITSVSVNDTSAVITDAGDDDAFDSFMAEGKSTISGSLTIKDPIQAQALRDAAPATVTFKGKPEAGGVEVEVTITNAKVFGRNLSAGYNQVWGHTCNLQAYAPDGQINPLTEALVAA